MIINTLWRRLRLFANRDAATRDMQEEMRLHLELRAEQLGSRAAASRQFGNRTALTEDGRAASGFAWLEHALLDLKYAARRIKQKPAFAAAVIGVTALGIGATTAMFSAVDAAMLRPLPFANPSQLVWLREISVPFDPGSGVSVGPIHMPDVNDVSGAKDLFSATASYAAGGLNVSDEDHPVRINAGVVTVDFFQTLGVFPGRGRAFSAEEGRPGGPLVAIISNKFWRQHFGARDITDATLSLNGNTHRVVGVMPAGFAFPKESDVWIPMSVPMTFATVSAFRGFLGTETIARLADGLTPERAAASLAGRWEQMLAATGGAVRKNPRVEEYLSMLREKGILLPFQEQLVGDKRTALLTLLGATALLLLIACANVTNLLLSQASIRRREMALREVLGATRGRIIRQLLVESAVLALAGASFGVALAPAGLKVVGRLLPPALVGLAPAQVDMRVLAFAAALALSTGILFGLWPALGSANTEPDVVIKSGGGHGATAGKLGQGRRLLVATELALTIVLLIGAGLMLRSFEHVMGLDSGLDAQRVATLELSFRRMSQAERMIRVNSILASMANTPGITAAGAINDLPLRGGGGIAITVEIDGAPKSTGDHMEFARYLMASSGYFDAMGIRLASGRTFNITDDSLAPRVAVIGASMSRKYWPNRNPIGRTFRMPGGKDAITVVGVVADVREQSLEKDPEAQMYFPIAQQTPPNIAVIARSALPAAKVLAAMQAAVRQADRTQAVYNVRMMDEVVGASVSGRRTNMMLITIFAGVALVLSALGVYAAVSYGVAQRGRELGIRAALGARSANLMTLVAGELMWVSLIGVAAGLAGGWALSTLVSSMLYGISPHDPTTFALVPLALLLPAAIAAIIPAYRASQVDPAVVLRAD